MSTSNTQGAVRALRRLAGAHQRAISEAAAADAGFDAGEWSAAYHDRQAETSFEADLATVAARYGMQPGELYCAVMTAEDAETSRLIEALNARNNEVRS